MRQAMNDVNCAVGGSRQAGRQKGGTMGRRAEPGKAATHQKYQEPPEAEAEGFSPSIFKRGCGPARTLVF